MPFPTSRQAASVERVAESIDGALSNMVDRVSAYRNNVLASNSVSSLETREIYQLLAATRRYVETSIASVDAQSLVQAYVRRFPGQQNINLGAEWATAYNELGQTIQWFQSALPKDANGRPSFDQFNPSTGELQAWQIPLTDVAKSALIGRLNAIMAAFS